VVTLATTLVDAASDPAGALAELYYRRWQVETVNSMIKRRPGLCVASAKFLEPVPRDHPPGHHTERDDRHTYPDFLQSN
jgi:hypothetical protein